MTLKGRSHVENPSRRRVLTAALTGAAATALMGSRVSATTPTNPPSTDATQGTDSTDGSEAPTTTAAPSLPTEADRDLLGFAQGAELAARDLYAMAIDAGATGDGDQVLEAARANHQAAADALSALIGAAAPQAADEGVVSSMESSFTSDDLSAVAEAAAELENTLVSTHIELIGQLENPDGASRIAAILIAEAQLATALTHLAGRGDDPAAMFDNSASALTPTEG